MPSQIHWNVTYTLSPSNRFWLVLFLLQSQQFESFYVTMPIDLIIDIPIIQWQVVELWFYAISKVWFAMTNSRLIFYWRVHSIGTGLVLSQPHTACLMFCMPLLLCLWRLCWSFLLFVVSYGIFLDFHLLILFVLFWFLSFTLGCVDFLSCECASQTKCTVYLNGFAGYIKHTMIVSY